MAATEITNMVMVYDRDTRKAVVIERERSWQGIAFPGGHLEDGESIYDSAIREIYEETGLKIHNLVACGFMHWYNNRTGDRYFTYFYKTCDYSGELIDRTDEGRVFWVDIDEIPKQRLAPNMEKYLVMFDGGFSEAFSSWNSESEQEIVFR